MTTTNISVQDLILSISLKLLLYIRFKGRARVDLNHRPTEPESVALSPEPRALHR